MNTHTLCELGEHPLETTTTPEREALFTAMALYFSTEPAVIIYFRSGGTVWGCYTDASKMRKAMRPFMKAAGIWSMSSDKLLGAFVHWERAHAEAQ